MALVLIWTMLLGCRTEADKASFQDNDGDGFVPATGDCDDSNADINPEAEEICDDLDNNCDGNIDEQGGAFYYTDEDGDGFGAPDSEEYHCEAPSQRIAQSGDCNDNDSEINPDAEEICDGLDNNCDGQTDDDSSGDAQDWFLDDDGDLYGDSNVTLRSCSQPEGYVSDSFDCNDDSPEQHPGALDIPNDGIDQDCSGDDEQALIAEELEEGFLVFSEIMTNPSMIEDYKGEWFEIYNNTSNVIDLFGVRVEGNTSSFVIDEHVVLSSDGYALFALRDVPAQNGGLEDVSYVYSRNDLRFDNSGKITLYTPIGVEIDSLTYNINDCPFAEGVSMVNGNLDVSADDGSSWCASLSSYGLGDKGTPGEVNDPCDLDGDGFTPIDGDCDDNDAQINPDAEEICDGLDNDCDTLIDDDDNIIGIDVWYLDADGDGYGEPTVSVEACALPDGYSSNALDCDDSDAQINPDAEEICDGVDNNCDTLIDDDDNTISQGQTYYADADGDGYGDSSSSQQACVQPLGTVANADDCNDSEPLAWSNAPEVCDGVDNNCSGDEHDATDLLTFWADADGDGYGDSSSSQQACTQPFGSVTNANDCNDSNASISPDANDICSDGIDNNCSGDESDAVGWLDSDGDGFGDPAEPIACSDPLSVHNDFDCNDADIDETCHTVQFTNGNWNYGYEYGSGSWCGSGSSCSFNGSASGTIDVGTTTCSFSYSFSAQCDSKASYGTNLTNMNFGNVVMDSTCGYSIQDIADFSALDINGSFYMWAYQVARVQLDGVWYDWLSGSSDSEQDTLNDIDCYSTYQSSSVPMFGETVSPSSVIPLD